MHDALDLRDLVADELAQRRETGCEVAGLEGDVELALRDGAAPLGELLDRLARVPRLEGWPYEEPSGFGEILALLPEPSSTRLELDEATLRDRLPETTRGRIRSVARDDDIDYTILGLHLLETHGFGFGPREVGAEWLDHLPFTRTYTAERVAYRNLVQGLHPPQTATYRNPYREWIGAQIRADIWGHVSPGSPRQAATLAFRDAAVSHTANGIYGEMWSAALIAACFAAADLAGALATSLEHIPPRSRLAEARGRCRRPGSSRSATWSTAPSSASTTRASRTWPSGPCGSRGVRRLHQVVEVIRRPRSSSQKMRTASPTKVNVATSSA
jgi:hypothetical protein